MPCSTDCPLCVQMVKVPQEKEMRVRGVHRKTACPSCNNSQFTLRQVSSRSHSDKPLPPGTDGTRVTGSDGISCHPLRRLTASLHTGLRCSWFQSLTFLVVESLPGILGSFPSICPIRANPVPRAFFNISEPEVEGRGSLSPLSPWE